MNSILVTDGDLKDLAESWLRVATVFFAVELAIMTFTIPQFLEKNHAITLYMYLGIGITVPMIMAVATFLAARDPRQTRFSTQFLIDSGVALIAISLFFTAGEIAYGTFVMVRDFTLSITMFFVLVSVMILFYPILYYKYLHKKNLT